MTNQELAATVIEVADCDAVYLDGDTYGRYADWSSKADGVTCLEVSDGHDCVQIGLTRSEMLRLHAALTKTLMRS